MRKHLFGVTLSLCLFVFSAAVGQITPIDDIQVYNNDGSIDLTNPHYGQVRSVRGVIYVYKGIYNPGSHYILGVTGGISFYYPAAPVVALGDTVEVSVNLEVIKK